MNGATALCITILSKMAFCMTKMFDTQHYIMLSVFLLSILMLSVVLISAIMLSVIKFSL
jgi:hypothetical protein